MDQVTEKSISYPDCLPSTLSPEAPWCFARVLEKLEDAVIIINTTACSVLFINTAAEELLTTLQLESSYDSLQNFFNSRNIPLYQTADGKETHSLIHNERIISCTINPLHDPVLCVQVKDVTEKKRLESIAQTVNTMDNLGFIFSGIRHEIGNPLNSIKMTNSVLQRNLERFSHDDISRYIERTASEISRMEYLLKSLKNFSMYEKTDIAPHCLKAFLETMLNLVEPDLEKRGIQVVSTPPAADTQVDIDPRALHQAILNIVTNAADALSNSNDATIDISTRANGRLAWVNISDNGCGMTAEQMQRLFQPFNTNKPHGNGLGLVITQKLLTMMQATLEIDSYPGRGTTARISLPLTKLAGNTQQPNP